MTDDPQIPVAGGSAPSVPRQPSANAILAPLRGRPGRPHLLIGLLFLVLGLLVTVVLLRPGDAEVWRTARTEDLVQILDDLGGREQRLEAESARLAALQQDLEAGSTVDAVAEAKRQLDALRVLTGTTPVTGPGIAITITDAKGVVDASVVLDAVQELRDAGAEAIQVGQHRVVVDTWFGDQDGAIVVDGTPVGNPLRILAIGDPDTMSAALSIPGGLADSVRTKGADFAASAATSMTVSVTVPESTD